VFIAIVVIIISYIFHGSQERAAGSVYQFHREYEPYELGPLKVGGRMVGGPGDGTFAPFIKIPTLQKFYVSIAEPDIWCANEDCGLNGAMIQTLGGWLQVNNTYQPEVEASMGLDLAENKHIKSLALIGDSKGTIVGIYPNKRLSDVMNLLPLHPDLMDFSFLNGVDGFGNLTVGELAPLKPGDSIGYVSDALAKHSMSTIPKGKKFYLFALQKRKYDMVGISDKHENEYVCLPQVGCRYPEPDPPHDFLFAAIEDLGGWFMANDINNTKLIELFGLDPQEVESGKSSLVILTDSDGVIRAIHPNKTLSDAITILSQNLEVVDGNAWTDMFVKNKR
jgi:hypothetical protein